MKINKYTWHIDEIKDDIIKFSLQSRKKSKILIRYILEDGVKFTIIMLLYLYKKFTINKVKLRYCVLIEK